MAATPCAGSERESAPCQLIVFQKTFEATRLGSGHLADEHSRRCAIRAAELHHCDHPVLARREQNARDIPSTIVRNTDRAELQLSAFERDVAERRSSSFQLCQPVVPMDGVGKGLLPEGKHFGKPRWNVSGERTVLRARARHSSPHQDRGSDCRPHGYFPENRKAECRARFSCNGQGCQRGRSQRERSGKPRTPVDLHETVASTLPSHSYCGTGSMAMGTHLSPRI